MRRFWHLLLLLFSLPVFAQTISLNPSFGTSGFTLLANKVSGLDLRLESAALQTDGKIVVVGTIVKSGTDPNRADFLVARLNKNGSLDNSFGTKGMMEVDLSGYADAATCVAITSEGKIIVAGRVQDQNGNTALALLQLNGNGSLDASFGKSGKLIAKFAEASQATTIALQADGKIVVGGFIDTNNSDFLLLRFKKDGTPDKSFGKNGVVTQDFEQGFDLVASIAIQNDGKILAGGDAAASFPLVRYKANGELDKNFGKNGRVVINDKKNPYNVALYVRGLGIQSNGKIVAGFGLAGAVRKTFGVACINPNGTMDVSFGNKGFAATEFGFYAEGVNSIVLQPNGKIIAGGMVRKTAKPSNQYGVSNNDWDFALARFNPDGKPDASFGDKGKFLTNYVGSSRVATNDFITKLLLEKDRLLAVGTSVLYENQWGDPVKGNIASYQLKTACKGKIVIDAGSVGFKPYSIYPGYNPAATLQLKAKASYASKSTLKSKFSYFWSVESDLAIAPESEGKSWIQLSATGNGNYESTVTLQAMDENGCSGEKEFKIRVIDARCANNKVLVCKGKKASASTLCVSQKEVPGLLAKGGSLGKCE